MEARRDTIQRRLILRAVRELGTHPTAERVYEHVAGEHPTLSKATVYRNLGKMAEAGELLDIGNFMGSTHYDHNLSRHHHFVCDGCGMVFDVMQVFPELDAPLADMDNFEIRGCNLTFNGLCPGCR